jgi:hypothetical protein
VRQDVAIPFEEPLNALIFTWLDELEDPEFPLKRSSSQGYSAEEIDRRRQQAQRQINSLTKGLLEIVPYDCNHE